VGVAPDPAQLPFVLDPDTSGIEVVRRPDYDLYRRGGQAALVVLVHGPVPAAAAVRPRAWPVYRGYATALAGAGAAAAVADLAYGDVRALDEPQAQLERLVDAARSEAGVASGRVALWAFSGGGRLVGRWLEEPPDWLKVVGLTYPVAPPVTGVAVPVVLTRVGLERPEIQATVDDLLAVAPELEVIDVPNGRHGFDMLDRDDESRQAVARALDAVLALLAA
jgi:hypothetical protein